MSIGKPLFNNGFTYLFNSFKYMFFTTAPLNYYNFHTI
ncbi:hypothetical protein FM106_14475 [Brachybacterium faecium]|nr:hypothetical protein FM106_14475 [Brachybacterium faecium]